MASLRRAFLQRCLNLGQRNTACFQQYQQMIEKIRGLRDQPSLVLLDGRKACLDRLLAQFLGAVSDTFVDQSSGIRFRRARLGTLVHPLFQIRQRELAHDCLFGR